MREKSIVAFTVSDILQIMTCWILWDSFSCLVLETWLIRADLTCLFINKITEKRLTLSEKFETHSSGTRSFRLACHQTILFYS
jgi:hypothetical protein